MDKEHELACTWCMMTMAEKIDNEPSGGLAVFDMPGSHQTGSKAKMGYPICLRCNDLLTRLRTTYLAGMPDTDKAILGLAFRATAFYLMIAHATSLDIERFRLGTHSAVTYRTNNDGTGQFSIYVEAIPVESFEAYMQGLPLTIAND